MGWERITDRKTVRRAEATVGTELATLWRYQPDHVTHRAVHTRRFTAKDGRSGWIYTDGHIDWDPQPGQ